MTCSKFLRAAAALAWLALPQAGWSAFDPVNDDTDIFLANPAFSAVRPNVLIFVDNTANWSQATGGTAPLDTKYGGVRAALVAVMTSVVTDAFNVGLSLFVETGSPNNNTDGSYVRYGIRQMTSTNKSQLVSMINALDNTGDKGNNATYSLAMAEMFNYFAGVNTYSGHGKDKSDAGGTIYFPSGRQAHAGSPLAAGALPANGGTMQTYVSPIVDSCQKNFIIVVSNGEAGDNASSLTTAQNALAAITGTNPPATIPITPNGEQGLWSDEYAKFMATGDCNSSVPGVQNVYTYTLDILPKTAGQGPSHTAMLKSMALNGKGKYFAITDMTSTAQLENAFKSIFTEVQAVNSVFASTTLPVSVNVRGTNLNQVYIGVFRPDQNKSPRWLGNVKLYKLGVDSATQNLFIADASGAPAENASTGFISANATSFWTATSSYWGFRDPSVNGVGGASDRPDGDQVEKGGAAQRLRVSYATSHTTRNLYTCLDGSGGLCAAGALLSATPFNTTNVAAADVGGYTAKTISSLTSLGTTATCVVTAHGYSTGNLVRISGVSPVNYNGDFTITVVDANTFTYTLVSAPDATRARVTTAAAHNLVDGDLTCTSANPSDYNNCWTPITRIDATHFDYTPGVPASVPGTAVGTNYGGRAISMVVGVPGQSTVKVVLPNHGYGAPGTVFTETYLLPGPGYTFPVPDWYWWDSAQVRSTVLDANTISMPAYPSAFDSTTGGPVFGTTNAAQVTATNHGLSTGQSVTISGSLVFAYNGAQSITKIDANSFIFASTDTNTDTSGAIRAGAVVSTITHPTSGAPAIKNTATVTTATGHGFAVGQNIQIFGTPNIYTTAGACLGYDTSVLTPSWLIQSTPSATTFTINASNVNNCPASLSSAGMFAGVAVSRIDPARTDSGNIIHWKTLNITAFTPLTTGTGAMLAGRPGPGTPNDIDTTLGASIVNWTRSQDNKDNEDLNGIATDVRASAHGDVLHSRPATINYNRYGDDNDIYAYYGSNDGILHAVKGGIAAHATGPDTAIVPGSERWGFVPQEFFPRLKRLRDQVPTISNISQKDYFFDGSIGVYQKDVKGNGIAATPLNCDPADTVGCSGATVSGVLGDNIDPIKGDKVHLYLSLRRGGNFIYALNVLNPAAPKLLWRKGNGDAGWEQLGQSWSEPKVARVAASLGNANNPDNVVLIFGGGYDDRVDDINPCLLDSWFGDRVVQKAIGTGSVTYTAAGSCTISGASGGTTTFNRTTGNALMVVDAFNGNVVWQVSSGVTTSSTGLAAGSLRKLRVADMTCGIPSDITVLDKNRDGLADRLYTGDTCGNVWRADITDPNIDRWAVTKIAALSGSGATTITSKVKFLFPPDLVFGTDGAGNYTAVLLGSGDREHPFDATVQNAFYMIKDRNDAGATINGAPNNTTVSIGATTPPVSPPAPVPTTQSVMFDATNVVVAATDAATTASSQQGWFVSLRAGEKVVGSAVTIAGTTFFNTNQPSSAAGGGACNANLGIAREYLVGFADAAATVDLQGLGTLSIANRSTIHAGGGYLPSPVPVVVEIDGKKYQAVISGTSVQTPPGLTLEKRTRAFWYKQID